MPRAPKKKVKRISKLKGAENFVWKSDEAPPATSLLNKKGKEISSGAGFWIRFLARLLDFIYFCFLGLFAGTFGVIILVVLQRAGQIEPGWGSQLKGLHLIPFLFNSVGVFLYHLFLEGFHGATLGKLICGLRVLQQNGQPSNFKGAFIRTLAFYVDGLFFGLVGWNSMQKSPLLQRYGDVWGKTIVAKSKDIPSGSERSGERFLLALFLGTSSNCLMCAMGLIFQVLITG